MELSQKKAAERLNEIINNQIGDTERKLTLEEISGKSGLSVSTLCNIFRGQCRITPRSLHLIVEGCSTPSNLDTNRLLAESISVVQYRADIKGFLKIPLKKLILKFKRKMVAVTGVRKK